MGLTNIPPLQSFLYSLREPTWFSHLGESLSPQAETIVGSYLHALKKTNVSVKITKDWGEATGAARSPNKKLPDYSNEMQIRTFLRKKANEIHSPESCTEWLNISFSHIAKISENIARAGRFSTITTAQNVFLAKTAAGAFAEASYDNVLWLLAQESGHHPTHLKFTLFKLGRWPIGIKEDEFYIW